MGNTFSDTVCFKKAWRPSQVSLMSHVEQDLADGRLHYVVASGSGKKSIGLELIRRLDAPALILAQTQAASDEWRARLQEDFLPEGEALQRWASKDASVAAPIISVTYQTLFHTMNIGKPFAKWMQNAGVQTLCLDEPHHLRNEWWKMLEKLVGQMPELRIITLTTTEPLDVSDIEWERYQNLCGPVDERIEVADLAKEGVLCPHQDYVYLCRPTEQDEEQIRELRAGGETAYAKLLHDAEFLAAVKTHLGLAVPDAYEEFFQENQAYKMALLSYLKENGEPIPDALLGFGGSVDAIPRMNVARMECLLKGFFGYDKDSYDGCREYQKRLEVELKEMKAILRGKVDLLCEIDVKRVLSTGVEKYPAIEQIVRREMKSLGDDMRMLILTEHIKKEQMPIVGEEGKALKDIGALPVFEALRRANIDGLYMMIMTSTLMVIPEYLVPWFEEHTSLKWAPLKESGYSRLQFTTDCQEEAMKWMTAMFEEGYANVLIATGTQLQENWTTACINSLVMATKLGHLPLTNRMRSLAALADPERPNRVTNIWHVVTVDPGTNRRACGDFLRRMGGELRRLPNALDAVLDAGQLSEDLDGMVRCFHAVMGLRREGVGFESGIARVMPMELDFSAAGVEAFNQKELEVSEQRERVRLQWQETLRSRVEVTEEVISKRDHFPKTEGQKQAQRGIVLCAAGILLMLVELLGTNLLHRLVGNGIAIGMYAVLIVMLAVQMRGNVRQLAKKKTPQAWMEGMAKGVMEALQDGEVIVSPTASCVVRCEDDAVWHMALGGATALEQEAFAACLTDFLGPIGESPYLLLEKYADGTSAYYPVPELFSYSKADARLFYRNMNEYMGDVILIYTGAEMGYASLKEAQWKSYERANELPVYHKKTSMDATTL